MASTATRRIRRFGAIAAIAGAALGSAAVSDSASALRHRCIGRTAHWYDDNGTYLGSSTGGEEGGACGA